MEPHNKVKDAELLSKYDCIKRTKKMVSSEQCSVTDINVICYCLVHHSANTAMLNSDHYIELLNHTLLR